jgi:hypothetical protein
MAAADERATVRMSHFRLSSIWDDRVTNVSANERNS